jgi:hypothetical protein
MDIPIPVAFEMGAAALVENKKSDDIEMELMKCGCVEYIPIFLANKIDMEAFKLLTEADIRELVDAKGPQVKLLARLKQLQKEAESSDTISTAMGVVSISSGVRNRQTNDKQNHHCVSPRSSTAFANLRVGRKFLIQSVEDGNFLAPTGSTETVQRGCSTYTVMPVVMSDISAGTRRIWRAFDYGMGFGLAGMQNSDPWVHEQKLLHVDDGRLACLYKNINHACQQWYTVEVEDGIYEIRNNSDACVGIRGLKLLKNAGIGQQVRLVEKENRCRATQWRLILHSDSNQRSSEQGVEITEIE